MDLPKGQLTARGIAIGVVGCVVITASSVYTALKMGSLPWPTIFTSITALVLLRAMGRTSLNEANVTQVIMSAGSMVAGGLAFTVPGIWILGAADTTTFGEMLAVALTGTLLGLVATALIRKRFVEDSDLEYPIGTAAAETLLASRDFASTGDGELTAIQVLSLMRRDGRKLSELASAMTRYPQVMINVRVSADGKLLFYTDPEVKQAVEEAKRELGQEGRIVVRISGTEPLIRVMVEGQDDAQIRAVAERVAGVVRERLGE